MSEQDFTSRQGNEVQLVLRDGPGLGADAVQQIGDAALSALGMGLAQPFWDMMFPVGQPLFSEGQLQQLETLFKTLFAENDYEKNYQNFVAIAQDTDEYVNNPSQQTLPSILTNSQANAQQIFTNGYKTASVFIAARLIHILALKLQLEITPEQNASGAIKSLVTAAVRTLCDVKSLEESYGTSAGWRNYIAFKRATIFGDADFPAGATDAFGADYVNQINKLMKVISDHDPTRMGEIPHPAYSLMIAPTDKASTPETWSYDSHSGTGHFYKIADRPAYVPANYYPLGDLASCSPFNTTASRPMFNVFIAAGTSPLSTPESFVEIYNDHGSGNSRNISMFSATPSGFGTYSSKARNSKEPDNVDLCRLVNKEFVTPVNLGDSQWSDHGSGADDDVRVYDHPQFAEFGVYCAIGSYDRPSPDSVNGLSPAAISGFPPFVPPA